MVGQKFGICSRPSAGRASFDVRCEKASLFDYQGALSRLEGIRLRGLDPGLAGRARLHVLNTMLGLGATQQVCAVGALLAHIVKARGKETGRLPGPAPLVPLSVVPLLVYVGGP